MTKTYLTTAIPYANGAPHIGHAMDYLLADVFARYRRELGDEVKFQAGTDEHGNKIAQKAAEQGITPQELADRNSQKFRDFIQKLGVEYTDFIRTTDPHHEARVQEIWRRLAPHLYKASYEGWYCNGCERFITAKEVEENGNLCPDHQKPYEKLSEENYYFRIADFKDEIRAAIESGTMQVLPDFRRREVLKLLADSPDVSVSRPKKQLSWGVPVPGDEDQVMYVWIDALANYLTVLGYPTLPSEAKKSASTPVSPVENSDPDLFKVSPELSSDFRDFWPAAAQFVGKDILRFHAIIWPAMLLALGLPLPKTIVSHGHVLSNGQKMSKSIGNVVDPLEAIDRHGLPAFRYFFLRHIDTFADSDFTWEKFDAAYAGELANDYGNLVQRLATLAAKNSVPGLDGFAPLFDSEYCALMDRFEFSKAFDFAWLQIQQVNKSIDEAKPWELAKQVRQATSEAEAATAQEKLVTVLQGLIKDLLSANLMLKPFLPETARTVQAIFSARIITPPETPLFPKAPTTE